MAYINGKQIALSPRLTIVNDVSEEVVDEKLKQFADNMTAVGKDYVASAIAKTKPRLINRITLTEDVKYILCNLDSEGKPFSVQPFYVVFDILPDFEVATTRTLSFRANTSANKRFLSIASTTFGEKQVGLAGVLKVDIIGGMTVSEVIKFPHKDGQEFTGNQAISPVCSLSNNWTNPISSVKVYFYDSGLEGNYVPLKAGSTIELWGCDYENLS
ncbi:MAG: hypothetical protein UHH95_01365 [Oscillospiraceae bacterium]|nr:hypothetical protein [Oscillospiraceae bacterium]